MSGEETKLAVAGHVRTRTDAIAMYCARINDITRDATILQIVDEIAVQAEALREDITAATGVGLPLIGQ